MCETAYYVNNLSTNAHNDIYSTNNARKILEGKPALAIPMRALKCTWITVQKQVRLHGTSAPTVRKHSIPLRALILYLDPSLQTYVCPFLIAENEIFIFCEIFSFSVNSQTERKFVPDNARTGTKMTKTGHFGRLRIWGLWKNAPMGITMRG